MDDLSSFVFTATSNPDPAAPTAGPNGVPSARRRVRPFPPELLARLGPVAATILVVAGLVAVGMWERRPRSTSWAERGSSYLGRGGDSASPSEPTPDVVEAQPGVPPRPPGHDAGGGSEGSYAGISPRRPDEDRDEDDVAHHMIEERLRDRLRREGKLPPESGSIEDFRQRIEKARETFVRFTNGRGSR